MRKYRVKNFVNCPIPGSSTPPMFWNLTFPDPDYNKFDFKGNVIVNEQIDGDIFGFIEKSRCSLDMKTCQKLPSIKIDNMCEKFAAEKTFYSSVVKNFNPPLRCPFRPGNFTFPESSVDLSVFSMLSIDGYVFVIKYKNVLNGANNVKKTFLCYSMEVEVTKVRVRN
jgi:hypothetical protein